MSGVHHGLVGGHTAQQSQQLETLWCIGWDGCLDTQFSPNGDFFSIVMRQRFIPLLISGDEFDFQCLSLITLLESGGWHQRIPPYSTVLRKAGMAFCLGSGGGQKFSFTLRYEMRCAIFDLSFSVDRASFGRCRQRPALDLILCCKALLYSIIT